MNFRPTLRYLAALLAALAAPVMAQTPAPSAQPGEITITLHNEGGEQVMLMQDFLRVVQTFFPQARGGYDPRSQIMRIEAGGKQFDVLVKQKGMAVNGRYESLDSPLKLREGRVLVPGSTVKRILTSLNIDVTGDQKTQPTPFPAITQTPALTPASPQVPSLPSVPILSRPSPTPSPTPAPAATPEANVTETTATTEPVATPAATPRRPVMIQLPSRPEQRRKPSEEGSEEALQPPQALAGTIGLSWAQLADLAHRQAPSRITIVCDGLLEPVAQQIAQGLGERIQIESNVLIAANGQRADDTLVAQVQSQQPQLVLDLIAARQAADKPEALNNYSIWVVNSALWPEHQTVDPALARYATHEFQSLALGSLLRTKVGEQFPDQAISYELSPSYLLRRVDAPSAAMLVPLGRKAETLEPERAGRIASSVESAVVAYIHGMSQVGF